MVKSEGVMGRCCKKEKVYAYISVRAVLTTFNVFPLLRRDENREGGWMDGGLKFFSSNGTNERNGA
jgi:hypothetical protein